MRRQFASLCWSGGGTADRDTFAADFLPGGAALFPAACPVRSQSVDAFIERLSALAGTGLHSFHERAPGVTVRAFGNVAVAVAGCEITENGTDVTRGAEMLLLVREEGRWRIAAQGWDTERSGGPLPGDLASPRP